MFSKSLGPLTVTVYKKSGHVARLKIRTEGKRFNFKLFESPFKGSSSWEMQIGPVVLHWLHSGNKYRRTRGVGNFRFWFDSSWMR